MSQSLSNRSHDEMVKISEMAEQAYDAFYTTMNELIRSPIPAVPLRQHRYADVFVRMGALCFDEGVSSVDFVKSALGRLSKSHAYTTPADIMVPKVASKTLSDLKQQRGNADEQYKYFSRLLLEMEAAGMSERQALVSSFTQFPAWFRIFYPESPDEKLVSAWVDMARDEIERNHSILTLLREKDEKRFAKFHNALYGKEAAHG